MYKLLCNISQQLHNHVKKKDRDNKTEMDIQIIWKCGKDENPENMDLRKNRTQTRD